MTEQTNLGGSFPLPTVRENLEAATLQLPPETIAELDSIAGHKK
jgi:hypothetical protein